MPGRRVVLNGSYSMTTAFSSVLSCEDEIGGSDSYDAAWITAATGCGTGSCLAMDTVVWSAGMLRCPGWHHIGGMLFLDWFALRCSTGCCTSRCLTMGRVCFGTLACGDAADGIILNLCALPCDWCAAGYSIALPWYSTSV